MVDAYMRVFELSRGRLLGHRVMQMHVRQLGVGIDAAAAAAQNVATLEATKASSFQLVVATSIKNVSRLHRVSMTVMSMLDVHRTESGILTKGIRRDIESVARVMSECDVLYIDNP